MRIQHNIMAMNAYRNYNTNTSALSKNLERLSSGYKINRAGDDAAGLAISEKMRAQITGLNAAQKNVKDGISLVKTAEGAMQEIQDMLNRMDYLATQSANGTYDDPVDRANLQKEVDALKTEINRIADSANFNGINLLDGSQSATGSVGTSVNIDLKVDNADCGVGQLHEKGQVAQKAEFSVDLNGALNNLKAAQTINAGDTFEITVSVGGQDVTLEVTAANSVSAGASIEPADLAVALAAGQAQTVTGVADASGATADFKISLTNTDNKAQLKFELKGTEVDFSSNMDVEIAIDGITAEFNKANKPEDGPSTYSCETVNTKNGYALTKDQLAHGEFEFTKAMANALAGGGELILGDVKIKFDKTTQNDGANPVTPATGNTVGKEGVDTYGEVSIGVKDLLDANGNIKVDDKSMSEMLSRISQAASTSKVFAVGVAGDNMISLTEKSDYYDSSTDSDSKMIDSVDKFKGLLGCTSAGSGSNSAGGLTLQIGDTSDSYNQMTVSIGDMHTSAMSSVVTGASIADIDISTQKGAQEAIQTIRDAVNYVSSVRGDLGATQNRLEHTANNLSVMAENIQDAESTIRDTDIAEEMMSYTKNNILVQSAQAMLAQANAVPQGVLQLLG